MSEAIKSDLPPMRLPMRLRASCGARPSKAAGLRLEPCLGNWAAVALWPEFFKR